MLVMLQGARPDGRCCDHVLQLACSTDVLQNAGACCLEGWLRAVGHIRERARSLSCPKKALWRRWLLARHCAVLISILCRCAGGARAPELSARSCILCPDWDIARCHHYVYPDVAGSTSLMNLFDAFLQHQSGTCALNVGQVFYQLERLYVALTTFCNTILRLLSTLHQSAFLLQSPDHIPKESAMVHYTARVQQPEAVLSIFTAMQSWAGSSERSAAVAQVMRNRLMSLPHGQSILCLWSGPFAAGQCKQAASRTGR